MKKVLALMLTTSVFGVFAQNNLHDAKILGSISIGNQEITSVLDVITGCTLKSTLHTKNLFEIGENVKLDMRNGNQSKIIKPNLSENVFVDKCNRRNPNSDIQMTGTEFKENVALLDSRVRSINSQKHVKEITLVDFSNRGYGNRKRRIVINGIKFSDEGMGHDQVANDGVYTSFKVFNNGNLPFQYIGESLKILSNPIINSKFKRRAELKKLIVGNNYKIEITCDVQWADCPNTDWWNTSLFGEQCIEFTNCSVTVGF